MKHWLSAAVVAVPAARGPCGGGANRDRSSTSPTASSTAQDIVLGPDGKLWFTENAVDKIGRVTPGNPPLIEEFDVPTNFVEPLNITVGPDNKIWFSGKFNGAGGVGRMDPANPADTQGHGGYGVTEPSAGSPLAPMAKIWLGDAIGG